MNEFFQSRTFFRLIAALGVLLVALVIFLAGTAVGYREAGFAGEWNSNYLRQFGGPGSPLVGHGDQDDSFMSAHGAFGEVIGVRLPEIMVKGPEEGEKTVIVSGDTTVRRFHEAATTTDIAPGETVVVIGEPDSQGIIHASLVRIMPPPPNGSSTSPSNSAPSSTASFIPNTPQ